MQVQATTQANGQVANISGVRNVKRQRTIVPKPKEIETYQREAATIMQNEYEENVDDGHQGIF